MFTTFSRSRFLASQLTVAAVIGAGLIFGIGSGTAQARVAEVQGDLGWQSVAVKRLANCAVTMRKRFSVSGDAITQCNNAATNRYWDYTHLPRLSEGGFVVIRGRQVAPAPWGSCPAQISDRYIKCFFVEGKKKGHTVMTVSDYPGYLEEAVVWVSWYYL